MSKELEELEVFDVLDTFSKLMFFSKPIERETTKEVAEQNKKNREKWINQIRDYLWEHEQTFESEPLCALEEVKNGLLGHCRSSYLKEKPEELQKIIDIYNGCFNKIETAFKALQIIKKKIYSVRNDSGMICDKSNIHYQVVVNQLTQEEFDLLKEVLL